MKSDLFPANSSPLHIHVYIIETFDDPIIINAKEKETTQTISKGAYALQPTLRFLFFKHHLEVIYSTFRYQSF